MNDSIRRLLSERGRGAFFVFGYCGFVGILVDLDHIWKIFGLVEPINLTFFPGRCLHTTLVFILYGCIAGCIAFAYAHRQNLFRWRVDVFGRRTSRSISFICWDNYSYDCDNCVYKYMCTKEVEIIWS